MAPDSRSGDPDRTSDSKEGAGKSRTKSMSEVSEDSQTAAEFISSQLQLEADAREALPYKFDTCTRPLGALRQLLFACLTCNPPLATATSSYTPAAVCYSCSVQCHGEHTLVELFNKRNFVCDCGTTRLPATSPCSLRINPTTNQKGGVVSEPADENNKYNQNFQNKFCGCGCDYDAHQQKGTMFQCLGLGSVEEGGCGEDWYHPGCVVGLGPTWFEDEAFAKKPKSKKAIEAGLETIAEDASVDTLGRNGQVHDHDSADESDDDALVPPGFPNEDDFEGFICYKCVDAFPWIKRYAGTNGFLMPVFRRSAAPSPESLSAAKKEPKEDVQEMLLDSSSLAEEAAESTLDTSVNSSQNSKKRKAEDDGSESSLPVKRMREVELEKTSPDGILNSAPTCKWEKLPSAPEGTISLFFKYDFRNYLCRCSDCFPKLAKHSQLLEEEESYEPPVSEDGEEGSTVGSGSLLDRGERALTNMDRVKAIEGVMAYNHLKEKLTPFFKEFADSGRAISADDIKAHFAKLRGDEEAIRQAGEAAAHNADNRREESGY